jgi:hypothetical protein
MSRAVGLRWIWRATTTVSGPVTGQVIDTCATGRVTWKADLL